MYCNVFNLLRTKSTALSDHVKSLQKIKTDISFLNCIVEELVQFKPTDIEISELVKNWPIAIYEDLICRPGDELIKAQQILNLFVADSVKNKDVMALGEYKKELTQICLEQGAASVNETDQYDMIIAYDTFDYRSIPITIDSYKNKLKDNGKLYVRFHPWCSRTGGRTHTDLNMAWVHLVFTPQEMFDIFGYVPNNNVFPIFKPLEEYTKVVSNFKVLHHNVVREDIEDFFYKDTKIIKRINSHYDKFDGLVLPSEHLSILYVDYVLGK